MSAGLDDKIGLVTCHGALDVLVNNAGIVIPGTGEDATLADWRTTQAVNQAVNGESVFLGAQRAIAAMRERGGSIITISSIEGIVGEPRADAYNYSKGGVRIFTKSADLACGQKGYPIQVNSIHPGFILAPLVEEGLASDESKYMTGAELVIDGGYTCH